MAQFADRILIATRSREEMSKFSSSAETEKVKKELESIKKESSETRGSLETALKANEDLSGKLKIVVDVHSRCEAAKQTQKAKLVELTSDNKKLKEEVELLKSNLNDLIVSPNVEQLRNEGLRKEVEDSRKELKRLKSYILEKHELDFQKVLNQVAYFYQIPINEGNFDVGKDIYKGELMSLVFSFQFSVFARVFMTKL